MHFAVVSRRASLQNMFARLIVLKVKQFLAAAVTQHQARARKGDRIVPHIAVHMPGAAPRGCGQAPALHPLFIF